MQDAPIIGTVRKDGHTLTTIDTWHRLAPPKRGFHWKDGRSAKENARAWIDAAPCLQPDVAQVLANCRGIGPLRRWYAEPERRTRIDGFGGEPPNIDLMLFAEDSHGLVIAAIEAKADESFGNRLSVQYAKAKAAFASKPASKALNRIEALLNRFALDFEHHHVKRLRYQLLTGTAAALEEARRRSSKRAVVLLHELVTPLTARKKRERNASDLDDFLAAAFAFDGQLAPGDMAGPFPTEGDLNLYIGKARTEV